MNVHTFRGLATATLLLVVSPTIAQNFRFIWQGPAYYAAENQLIAERIVDEVIGIRPGSDAHVIFFRGKDRVPVDLPLNGKDGSLAELPSGSYFAIAVAPGTHAYSVDGQTLLVQAAPGERRYIRIGDYNANAQITASNAQTFLRMVTGERGPLYASN